MSSINKNLTDRQEEILNFINSYRELNGFPPTIREIAKNFGLSSTFGVKKHLDALVKKGYLHIESNASRGISTIQNDDFSERNQSFHKVPIVGRVGAGSPILAEQNIEGSLIIDSSFTKNKVECFALKVKGDSMIKAGILEDDFVIVERQSEIKNGDIIVALIEDEATVKTFENKNGKIRLIPENDNYQPIEIENTESFSIAGKVKGIIRYFN